MALAPAAVARLAAVALATTCLVPAAGARAETLADAVALAYASNPTLQNQRAAVAASDEAYVQTRAGLGPRVEFNAGGTYEEVRGAYFRSQLDEARGVTEGHLAGRTSTLGLSLSQAIYTGGRTRAALNAQEAAVLSARQTLRQAEIQVVQQVIAAYTAVRRDEQVLAVYRDNLDALARQLEQVRAEFAVREVTQTDVDITLGRVAAARNSVASAMAQLEISRSQYLQVVGQNPGELAPEPELDALPPSVDAAFDSAEAHNPSLLASQFNAQAAEFRVAEARRAFLPTVQVQLSGERTPVEPYAPAFGGQKAVTASVNLSQPLFESGLLASQVRQALAQSNQARASVEANRRAAVQAVTQAWSQLIAARTSLSADTTGVAATQAAFYGVRREQPFGLRLPIDVLNAEEELNAAELRVLQDRYNEYAARAGVLAAAGMLDAELIAPGLDRYDPAANFRRVRDKGAAPWDVLVRAVDGVGVAPLRDPVPPRREDGVDRPHQDMPLPPAPPPASTVKPFQSATEIMAAEKADAPPPGAPASDAPLSRCNVRERETGACDADGSVTVHPGVAPPPPPAPLPPQAAASGLTPGAAAPPPGRPAPGG